MIDIDALVLAPCLDAWGEEVAFYPAAGQPQLGMQGRFEEKFRETTFTDGDEAITGKPMMGMRQSTFLQQPVTGDAFLIRGRFWRIIDVLPDGNGHLHIRLALASDGQCSVAPTPPQCLPASF